MDIGKSLKFGRAMNGVVAGQSEQISSYIDTAGYDGIVFITAFGDITSGGVQSVKVKQSAASNGSSAADLLGSSVTVADDDDNQIVVHDIKLGGNRDRYMAIAIERATQNSVIDGVSYFLYNGSVSPATNDTTTVVALKSLFDPAEGTA